MSIKPPRWDLQLNIEASDEEEEEEEEEETQPEHLSAVPPPRRPPPRPTITTAAAPLGFSKNLDREFSSPFRELWPDFCHLNHVSACYS